MASSLRLALGIVAVAIFVAAAGSSDAYGQSIPFVTTWQTTVAGESIAIPVGGATGTYTVDWGDGSTTTHDADATHVYDVAGTYTVQISGDFTRIKLGDNEANAVKLRSIDQWGSIQWDTMELAFGGASNMVYNTTDIPDLSGVTDMYGMFASAKSFNGDISPWDVSSVTDMRDMFYFAISFNQPLNSWDVSSVTNMYGMFASAKSFNQPLNSWDVSSVTYMSYMFADAEDFNQPLDSWNVSSVKDMYGMFADAEDFNQPLDSWDVSSVTDMSRMFFGASSFNQPLDSWDVSNVKDMDRMFSSAVNPLGGFYYETSFNQPLDSWDVSNVTDMSRMFFGASSFNQPLDSWDVSSVTDMRDMFSNAIAFNQNLGNWYIVLGDTEMYGADTEVTTITAQNTFLNNSQPTYAVISGGDGDQFNINDTKLFFVSDNSAKNTYDITVTATDQLGLPLVHSKDVTITVKGSSIHGTVFSDDNANGVQDAGEEGIPDLAVLYVDVKDHSKIVKTTTNPLGIFMFDIPAGVYLVQIEGTLIYEYVTISEGQTKLLNFAFPVGNT